MLLGAKAGDVIWYYKTDKGVSTNSKEISVKKYKEMLMATVKDTIEIMGYGNIEEIQSDISNTGDKKNEEVFGSQSCGSQQSNRIITLERMY